jgi:hypothetical protein
MNDIAVLENGLLVKAKNDVLGSYLQVGQVTHPQGLPNSVLNQYLIHENGEHIDLETWNQMVSFFMYYAAKNLEVQARVYSRFLATPQDDLPTYIVVVPKQTLSAAAVVYDYSQGMIDLDGYEYTSNSLQDLGYICFGHFHLHPFDFPNPSTQDDANELGDTGLYGIISLPNPRLAQQYRIRMTMVANNGATNRRYSVDPWELVALPVTDYIQTYTPVGYTSLAHDMIVGRLVVPLEPTYSWTNKTGVVTAKTFRSNTPRVTPQALLKELEALIAKYGLTAVDNAVGDMWYENQNSYEPQYDGQYLLSEGDFSYA